MKVLVIGSDRISEMTIAFDSINLPYIKVQINKIREIFLFLFNLIKSIHSSNFDLIIFDYIIIGPFAYIISKIYNVPLVMRLRGDVIYETQASARSCLKKGNILMFFLYSSCLTMVNFLLYKCNAIIVVSDYLRSCLPCELHSKCFVCPTPINPDKFDYVIKEQSDVNSITLLTVSNFNYYEKAIALRDALKEASEVMKESLTYHIKWLIVGGGRYLYIVQDHAKKYDVDIHFMGFSTDVGYYYKNADIFLYFSYLDAYPNVILEAQLAGLPVITNKGYGMVNQIIDGKNGLLIDLKKQASIKNSLGKLVRSKSKREMLGNNSNNKIIQENAPINVGKAFENIFYEVMNKRHSKYW